MVDSVTMLVSSIYGDMSDAVLETEQTFNKLSNILDRVL